MELKYIAWVLVVAAVARTSEADCVKPANLYGAILTPSQSTYTLWSRVTLSCQDGYSYSGPEYSYCADTDTWKPALDKLRCQAQCKIPDLSPGVIHYLEPGLSKSAYNTGDIIHYACAEGDGATLIGPIEATCSYGQWEPPQSPTCRQCAPPALSDPKIVRASPSQESYPAYTKVTLSCADGAAFTATGPDSTYCEESGEWLPDPTKMTCHEMCAAPVHDPLVSTYPVEGAPGDAKLFYKFNEIVVNACPEGKLLAGPMRQRCNNGAWLPGAAVTCQ